MTADPGRDRYRHARHPEPFDPLYRRSGATVPETLFEDLDTNLREGEAAVKRWNGTANGRIRCWFSLRWVSQRQ